MRKKNPVDKISWLDSSQATSEVESDKRDEKWRDGMAKFVVMSAARRWILDGESNCKTTPPSRSFLPGHGKKAMGRQYGLTTSSNEKK